METELFASVEAGDLDKFKELIKKETKETIDQGTLAEMFILPNSLILGLRTHRMLT